MSNLAEAPQESRDRFSQVIRESMLIKRHFQLFLWLQGDLQALLPHDILLSAYGDFKNQKVRYDIVSALPGMRTAGLAHVDIENLTAGLFERWLSHGRTAYSLGTSTGMILHSNCQCDIHRTLRSMRSVLVHGMRDERGGVDSLYVLFQATDNFDTSSRKMFEVLLPHIDFASRRVAGMPSSTMLDDGTENSTSASQLTGLTVREIEIMEWVRNGKTNHEIGLILNISAFTVKNHLQRIFRKIDVTNRAQAVSKIEDLTRRGQ